MWDLRPKFQESLDVLWNDNKYKMWLFLKHESHIFDRELCKGVISWNRGMAWLISVYVKFEFYADSIVSNMLGQWQ